MYFKEVSYTGLLRRFQGYFKEFKSFCQGNFYVFFKHEFSRVFQESFKGVLFNGCFMGFQGYLKYVLRKL